jgi:glutamate N-acetyltransferase/amino-acid N-acetyltransferase
VATDAAIEQNVLDVMLKSAVNKSFNRITVDGDTSTNDSCILIATGESNANRIVDATSAAYQQLSIAIESVLVQLAQQIITDGEGATKFVTLQVEGALDEKEALIVAYSVAQSPLVKTALFASDPNWGRIVAAIGYAGVENLDDSKVKVWLGNVLIVENGGCAQSYTEAAGQAVMDKDSITIRINLGRGSSSETIWTTDLSHDYVTINAEYRS